MMSRSISQTTAALSQITTEITTTVMIKRNAPRTLLTSSQLMGRNTPKDTPAIRNASEDELVYEDSHQDDHQYG
jgi:hypothetical protein